MTTNDESYDDDAVSCGMKGLIFALIPFGILVWGLAVIGALHLLGVL